MRHNTVFFFGAFDDIKNGNPSPKSKQLEREIEHASRILNEPKDKLLDDRSQAWNTILKVLSLYFNLVSITNIAMGPFTAFLSWVSNAGTRLISLMIENGLESEARANARATIRSLERIKKETKDKEKIKKIDETIKKKIDNKLKDMD